MGGSHHRQTLRIRSPSTFAVRWLIPRLASFHRANPNIDVSLTASSAPLDFAKEEIDAGVELGNGQWKDMKSMKLVANVLRPVVSPKRFADLKQLHKPADLAGKTLLHSLARFEDWDLWLKAAGVSGLNPFMGMKYETSLLAYQAAAEGHGVAVAQEALVERELAEGDLVFPFDFGLDRGDWTYYFSWPMARPESVALQVFRDWLRANS